MALMSDSAKNANNKNAVLPERQGRKVCTVCSLSSDGHSDIQRRIVEEEISRDRLTAFIRQLDATLFNPYTDQPMEVDLTLRTISFEGHGKWAEENGMQVELRGMADS